MMNAKDQDHVEEDEGGKTHLLTDPADMEKQQEKLLAAKYGNLKAKSGGSLLKKKLAGKGTKYFDSGDYNMARAEMQKQSKSLLHPSEVTGAHMPTLEELPKSRKLPEPSLAKK